MNTQQTLKWIRDLELTSGNIKCVVCFKKKKKKMNDKIILKTLQYFDIILYLILSPAFLGFIII